VHGTRQQARQWDRLPGAALMRRSRTGNVHFDHVPGLPHAAAVLRNCQQKVLTLVFHKAVLVSNRATTRQCPVMPLTVGIDD